ncbi:MAG: TIGR03557 family F420-dependent LLM class oxidoreductase [Kibdelosporangium sp.]
MRMGYTLMTEQAGPKQLVRDAVSAERAGFVFEVSSDHYFPWLAEQGHAPNAWTVLGAVAHATSAVELMTYVTCPIMRYHPAVVAQQAATMQLLSDNRFTLGVGAGENLNEHVVGRGWPPVNTRHDMLVEAIQIISGLFDGGYFNFQGAHFQVDAARLWDLPEVRTPIAVEPSADLSENWDAEWSKAAKSGQSRKIGQLPVCWDPDRDTAVKRAHEQFRWFGGGWKVNAELPDVSSFAAATAFVRPQDVADSIPCGPDAGPIVEQIQRYADAGFTDLALVQIGGEHQDGFLEFAEKKLLPAL